MRAAEEGSCRARREGMPINGLTPTKFEVPVVVVVAVVVEAVLVEAVEMLLRPLVGDSSSLIDINISFPHPLYIVTLYTRTRR